MKIVFMGTPDFAVPVLEMLVTSGHTVSLAVTQPDRPKGRSGKTVPSPVKARAEELGIPVYTPLRLKDEESYLRLREEEADLFVVAAFGQILPQRVLDLPKLGCINVHASLLPQLRGASPIQHAILQGDAETGITIMRMDAGLDTGDILLQERIPIAPDETAGSLFDKLAALGAKTLQKALPGIEAGTLVPVPQDPSKASYAGMLRKEMGILDFARPAAELERCIRGMDPWPGAVTELTGNPLKVWRGRVLTAEEAIREEKGALPGTVLATDKRGILVQTGEGILALTEIQPAGKKRMTAEAFLLGHPLEPGTRLG